MIRSPADLIVVLGCKVHPDGEPSPMLVRRLALALEIWRVGLVPTLIVSGDGAAKEGVDEAAVMKAWLVAQGVPADAVVADGSGVNTRATATFTATWMQANGAASVIAVSQYFHLPRIRLAFRQAGVRAVQAAGADRFTLKDAPNVLRELVAYGKYLFVR